MLNQVKNVFVWFSYPILLPRQNVFKFSHIGIKYVFTPRAGERRLINLFYKEDLNFREEQPFASLVIFSIPLTDEIEAYYY